MIQKFTCVPRSDYNVIIVSNGTVNQIESKLIEINEHSNNEIPVNAQITYLDNFRHLVKHLNRLPGKTFNGKVLFMFFNGMSYIQDILSDLIDHYNKCTLFNSLPYFKYEHSDPADTNQFNTIMTIANDILKKMSFMTGRIRGLYIDDYELNGEKVYPLQRLMRNFPSVERIELSSYAQLFMNDMILA
ncbi:hypothetical protein PICST_38374 [Scheffersomyces stipitis CBS 6054]|uniref:Uncharacterized protein n=1 Tax=Scheffersomyces stipitis (strain ATCC 58785 / CBS 6054 / NBRC 10063 / NRRL Y-11545) TaxID=322104 RepID=A3GGK3_PICST|nr:predicted protein [Scheffersomyces stipitis CBS 6054]EAZ63536.1 hypothetical protein PICST_38374 [Scheffersomyces stipitis CBS 6054]